MVARGGEEGLRERGGGGAGRWMEAGASLAYTLQRMHAHA